jgi:hypothetical protein
MDEKRTVTAFLCAIKTVARQAPPTLPGLFQRVSLFMEVEQRYVIKFLVGEGMNGLEIIDRLNRHYGWEASQREQGMTGSRR